MRMVLTSLLVLSGHCLGGPAGNLLWKRVEREISGKAKWTDSLTYDAAGKLLGEVRRGADGAHLQSIQYHYDDSGRGHRTVKLSPDGAVLEEAACDYEGTRLNGWRRTADNVILDGITLSGAADAERIVYAQVALQAFRFTLDSRGRAQRVARLGGMQGGVLASARFGYDGRGRHVATYFQGPDSLPIGRDTLLLEKDGRLRELRRFDSQGKQVATVERGYGPRGELTRRTFKDAQGTALVDISLSYRRADSLSRLNRSASAWKGKARTSPCELEWHRNVELGIETATLYGLTQLYQPPPSPMQYGDAWRDSLDREREGAERWRNAYHDSLGACRSRGRSDCLARAEADLDALLRSNRKPWTWEDAADSALGLILELGGEAAYHRILGRVRGDTASGHTDQLYLKRLLRHRLASAYDGFCATPGRSPGLILKPGRLAGDGETRVPEGFREAVAYRRSLQDAYRRPRDTASVSKADTAAPRWTYAGLHRHIATYLRTGARKSLDSIEDYEWGGWCGTGSEALYGPKGDALLIRALVDGDFPAVLRRTGDPRRFRQLLLCRGLDWEAFFLGGAVEPGSEARSEALAVLTEFGSIAALRKLFALDHPDSSEAYPGWVEAMGTLLLEPGESLYPELQRKAWFSGFVRDTRAPAIPSDLRDAILARLKARVARDPFKVDTELHARIFSRIDFPEREAFLKLLAAVPEPGSRQLALQALGAAAPDTATLPSLHPVTFRITSGGEPFPYAMLNFATPCAAGGEDCSRRSGTSVQDGHTYLSRREYLAAWRDAKAIRLYYDYVGFENPLDGPLYDVVLPLVETPKDTIRVDIPLYRVAFRLQFPAGFVPEQEQRISVKIESLAPGAIRGGYPVDIGFRDEIVFSRLGDGKYRITLAVPGLKPWDSGPLRVRGDATHRVPLQAAPPSASR